MMNKKKLLSAFLLLCPLGAAAQMLHIEVADTALQKNAVIWAASGTIPVTFDRKGVFEYSDSTLKDGITASLLLPDMSFYSVVIDPDVKMTLKVTRKNGKTSVRYGGDNAPLAVFLNSFQKYYPARNWAYEQRNGTKPEMSFAAAFSKLQTEYDDMVRLAAKIKSEDNKTVCMKSLQMKNLSYRISLRRDSLLSIGADVRKDAELKGYMAQILPNDSDYASCGLVNELITYEMPIDLNANTDVTDYGVSYLQTAARTVSNGKIRQGVMRGVVGSVLSADNVDVERFWKVAKELCDEETIKGYQFVVDSKLSTKSGMKCPDVTFSDPDGKSHRLSEFFGKLLYIDLWATWCGPCCMEIPYLDKMVEHYKGDDRIQFISISMDRDHKAWLKKIAEDKPAWPQFNTNKEEDALLSKQWGVTGIPRFLIINPDGTINNADAFRPSDDKFIEKIDALLN